MKNLIVLILLAAFANIFADLYPEELLPSHITLDQAVGERPDWSPTGSGSYIFVDAPGGKPFEKDMATGVVRSIDPPGCSGCQMWRIYYLPNGDYLMTIGPDRGNATMQVVDKGLQMPPWDLGEIAHEGVAVSRHSFQLAWTTGANIQYGDLVYGTDGVPTLQNKRVILNAPDLLERDKTIDGEGAGATNYATTGYHEPQNWRPPLDRELIFSRYGTSNTGKYSAETWMWNMDTDEITNMSKRHAYYDEPEGVFPDGEYTLVECDAFLPVSRDANVVDLYRLKLDGTGTDTLRLTHFGDYTAPGTDITLKANQGVVSEDGKYMLFGEGRSNTSGMPGTGYGIYLFDFQEAGIEVGILPTSSTAPIIGKTAAFELNGSTLSFKMDTPGAVNILLMGSNGRIVRQVRNQWLNTGNHNVSLVPETIPAGFYLIKAEAGSTLWNSRFINSGK